MEDVNKKIIQGLPPLATTAQVWKKPYFMNDGGIGSGGTKTYLKPSDGSINLISSDEKNKLTPQNIPSDKSISISDGVVATAARDLSVNTEPESDVQIRWGRSLDPNMDPKKLKRIISNRISAQKSRIKKLQYIADMERRVKALETEIALLSPKVEFHKNQQKLLKMENCFLNQRISICEDTSILKDVQIEENKAEVDRQRQLYMNKYLQQMQGPTPMPGWETGLEQTEILSMNQSRLEEQVNMNSNQDGLDQYINFDS